MKIIGLDVSIILDFYVKEVRVHLELAVPVWHSGLTKKLCADIERVQRVAVRLESWWTMLTIGMPALCLD